MKAINNKKMYKGGGKMKPMYLKGGQVKLDANKDGEITGADFKILKEMKDKKMAKGGKMKAVYNDGGKVGDPEKKKEAMKLIALNEADWDNNLGDFYREGNMEKADSVRKVMMDRFKRIVELGYGDEAEDSLPYNSLTSMNAYEDYVQEQRELERGRKAPMGPFPHGVDTDGVKEKKMRPMFKKGGKVKKGASAKSVDFNLPYKGAEGVSLSENAAKRMWASRASKDELALGVVTDQDDNGNWVARTRLQSKA